MSCSFICIPKVHIVWGAPGLEQKMIMSVCVGRTTVYHVSLQLHRDHSFYHCISNANPERPLQGWGGWCISRITPFQCLLKKVKSATYRRGFRGVHITAKNRTEAIQQKQLINNQLQIVLILVGYKPVTYRGNNTMQYHPQRPWTPPEISEFGYC